jgi:hypothetical protein
VKKTIVILLMLIYGSATMGATVHLHYCMNAFVGWSLLPGNGDKCGRCGMEEKDKAGCCKDEHKHFKLKADHQKAGSATLIANIVIPAVITPSQDFIIQSFFKITESYSSCHAPPGIGDIKLNVLHCVFLI